MIIHLGTDLVASQLKRDGNLRRTRVLASVVPEDAALIAYWGNKDAAAPLLFTREIIILDTWADDGQDAPKLIRELFRRHRRVFVLNEGQTLQRLEHITAGSESTVNDRTDVPLLELHQILR